MLRNVRRLRFLRHTTLILMILAAMTLVTLQLSTSGAGFSALTADGSNQVVSGQLALTDDDSESATFSTLTGPADGLLTAGQTLPARCINVDYHGNWSGTTFDGGPLASWDPAKFVTNTPADVSVANGEMTIATTNNNTYVYANERNLWNRNFQAEFRQRPGSGIASLNAWSDENNFAYIIWNPFGINFRVMDGGVQTDSFLPYTAANMKYFRFSSLGSLLRMQYSGDGSSWTTGHEQVVNFDLKDIPLGMQTVPLDNNVAPYSAKFAAISVTPIIDVRLFATPSGDLTPYLNLTIERGTGATPGSTHSCTGFTSQTTVYTGTLAAMPTSYATGLDRWNPSSASQIASYRITVSTSDVQEVADKTADALFTWEVRSG